MIKNTLKIASAVSLLLISTYSQACTMAFWNNNGVAQTVARSMDLYMSDEPMLVVYPRGLARTGDAGEKSIKWTSKYGSVALTAFHSNAVTDGMNEHGLNAHLLYLEKSEYEKSAGERPALSNVLWAQYMLDNFKTVKEAVASLDQYQIVSTKIQGREWPLHIALEDPSGDSAIIEFIDGKPVVHHGKQYTVMTNDPAYDTQLNNLKKYKLFGGNSAMPGDIDPLSRFVRASSYLKTLPKPKNYIEAIAGINSVIKTTLVPFGAEDTSGAEEADTWATRWTTLSDLTNKIYYFSSTSAPNIVWVDFKKVKFNEGLPVLMIDPTLIEHVGDISQKMK
jgi:choloylglycine hydrolase